MTEVSPASTPSVPAPELNNSQSPSASSGPSAPSASSAPPASASSTTCPPPPPLARQLSRQVSDLAVASKIDDRQKDTLKMLLRREGTGEKNQRARDAAQKAVAKLEAGNDLTELEWDGLEQILSSFSADELASAIASMSGGSSTDPILSRLLSAQFKPPEHAPTVTKASKGKTGGREVVCYVIRHGERMDESDYQGWYALAKKQRLNIYDAWLTKKGHQQAADAGQKLKFEFMRSQTMCKAVLASPLERTAATGAQVSKAVERPLTLFTPAALPALIVRQHGLEMHKGWLRFQARKMKYTTELMRPDCLAKTSCSVAQMHSEHIVETSLDFKRALEVQMAACADGECVVAVTHREGIRRLIGTHRHIPYCAIAKFTVKIPPTASATLKQTKMPTATGLKPALFSLGGGDASASSSKKPKGKNKKDKKAKEKFFNFKKRQDRCVWKFQRFV